ncbi:polymerase delta-interacting protein 3 isoform X2 [Manduca sexta]|uniref:RRM domain-containing protein n=1 Tax=Manduca sexta TaxID=7130 RepID=A0A921YQ05_MANSE|nr:polymerase delta-interacting protein 3 isoform X2 [Manduca sexta]KAG6442607.1 hypothetical protein O3G_MSEX002486 [Manduca sexta]
MASLIDMSLEDIIKNKKMNIKMRKTTNTKKQSNPSSQHTVSDARNKIISKTRTQITDAREKLAQFGKHKDARLKLEQLRLQKTNKTPMVGRNVTQNQGKFVRQKLNRERDTMSKPKPLTRTVENDIDIIDESMEEEYIPPKPSLMNRKASLQLKIIAHNNDLRDRRNSLHGYRTAVIEKEKSPPRPPSILKKRPMAALRSEKKDQVMEKSPIEFRIIVSNLRNTVTASDIQELFGDVGGMVESRLVRPGTAEVIYKSQEDAQRAVDLYHNRHLDGQPMNCLLVSPRSSTTPRTSSKPALYSTNSNVEPDISTFHKVLFSNL